MDATTISVVGLGKLGACIAACAASKGLRVIGVDVNATVVELVNSGRAPVKEPGLGLLIATHQARLSATTDYRTAILNSDITFVVVPTPSEDHGGFSIRYVVEAAKEIGRAMAEKSGYHLVVITSTVLPGSTQHGILPVLEKESGKTCGQDFGLCYSPEFIALGSVIRDFLNPDFLLIGESDERAGNMLEACYRTVLENQPPVARMNFVNAELAKIAVNTFVTTKITFANLLAQMCEQLPGADVDSVTGALGMDSRIGRRYLTGALGYGGPCFPRDNVALGYLARQVGVEPLLAESTDQMNRQITGLLSHRIASSLPAASRIAVLGLSYKPDTEIVEESQGLELARELAESGARVVVFDPLALEQARGVLGDAVEYAGAVQECLADADAAVIANPSQEFRDLEVEDFSGLRKGAPVYDCWRILRDKLSQSDHLRYIPLGVGDHDPLLDSRLQTMWGEVTV